MDWSFYERLEGLVRITNKIRMCNWVTMLCSRKNIYILRNKNLKKMNHYAILALEVLDPNLRYIPV